MMGEFSAKGNYSWHSRISTKSIKAKALLDDAAVPTGTVYQPRSAKRKHIWHRGISTTISRPKAHLAQQPMMGECFFGKAKIQLAQPHIHNKKQAKALLDDTVVSARAVYPPHSVERKPSWHRGISTTISREKAYQAQPAMTFSQAKM